MLKFAFILLVLSLPVLTFAQYPDISDYPKIFELKIAKKKADIKVDGDINEAAWQGLNVADNFWLKFPRDDAHAKQKTEFKACYDDRFLYFAAKIFDVKPYVALSLKRDTRIRENDGISIVLDPFNKKTNGFYFSVSAFNVQADDVMSGNDGDLNFSYDNKWYGSTKQADSFYTIEMAIPFKTLRYDQNSKTWGINFIRSNRKLNEFNTWTRIPVNFRGTDLGWIGTLAFEDVPPPPGKNISLIPYINTGYTNDKITAANAKASFNAGLDAKVAVSSSLNLDLTLNPDFSQVDVDRQVTNLTRFSIFFPERRNFFLENSDLFSEFGIDPIRPFYSRRIGSTPNGLSAPIIGGARLSGNIAKQTRLGILNMQTAATNNYAAQNYTAATVQQRVLKRSSIRAYGLNRQAVYNNSNKSSNPLDHYGRNFGLENSYRSANGIYEAWLGYHNSAKQGISTLNNYLNFGAGFNKRSVGSFLNFDNVGKNYYTDMGFVERIGSYYGNTDSLVRNGFKSVYNETYFTIFPKKGKVNQHKFEFSQFYVLNPNNTFNEYNHRLQYDMSRKNSSNIRSELIYNNVSLLVPLGLTDGDALPVAKYKFAQLGVSFETDSRKSFVFGAGVKAGDFYNGTLFQIRSKLIYRVQPKFTFEINAEYNDVKLPAPYGNARLFLIAPRVEFNFSNNLFWTTFVQYNTQSNNMNFNSRVQWRYKPVSDLFLVYTDNYYTDPLFKNKNRAIVLKINYWLNM